MGAAEYDQTQIDIEANRHLLRATGSILRFEGFLKVYKEQVDEDDKASAEEQNEENTRLPDVEKGDLVQFLEIKTEQHFTQPPPRFSEESLMKELEEKGIGRQSTYAAI